MKEVICTFAGVVGTIATALWGGWEPALIMLLILMAADYITGLLVAGVFHASPKSTTGALESKAGWKGLCRKVVTLMIIAVANWIDLALGISIIRYGVIYGFAANELISLTENAGLMGLKLPKAIIKAIDVLSIKAEADNTEGGNNE